MTREHTDRRDAHWLLAAVLAALLLFGLVTPARAQSPAVPSWHKDAATLVGHSHTTGATITLSGSGDACGSCFIYIVGLDIANCQGAAAVTPAAPTFITTTGIVGSPQYMIASGSAVAGSCIVTGSHSFPPGGIKTATKGTTVTYVLPAFVTNQTVSVNVYYYLSAF